MFEQHVIDKIKSELTGRKQSIAIAESVTSGLLQAALSTAADAMKFYQGGITTYNIGQKARHLNIDVIHAMDCNCVSKKMAEDMAISACRMFTSDWGIGITGYASPVPESGNRQFAWFAICRAGEFKIVDEIRLENSPPLKAQLSYVNTVLEALADFLGSTSK